MHFNRAVFAIELQPDANRMLSISAYCPSQIAAYSNKPPMFETRMASFVLIHKPISRAGFGDIEYI